MHMQEPSQRIWDFVAKRKQCTSAGFIPPAGDPKSACIGRVHRHNKQLGIVPCAAQMASVNLSRLGGSCSVVRPERVLPSQLPAPQRVAHRWSRLVRSAQITLKTPDGTVTLEVRFLTKFRVIN